VLQNRDDSWFWTSDQDGNNVDNNLDVDRQLTLIDNGETAVVTARTLAGGAVAQWEFSLQSNVSGDCLIAGTVISS
jgi:hypothetical protein